ncbi:amidase [Camelimonas abortus]|uniref:Amidase n=1 Tax=Camelimonas abortus TaxID=1017184 RepID=A0ABV7LG79_9HYPH
MSNDFTRMSALEMIRRIRTKEISPVEVTRAALDLAAATQDTVNAFCVLTPEAAMAEARAAEAAVMRGDDLGPLHGAPFSVKDLIAVGGLPWESGSKAMKGNVAAADAPAVERARAAGAILIGKTTTSEFGCKPVGDSPVTGVTRNPLNLSKTPGGSSAGAAASVAAGVTPFALGTDGGGSIRIPCSFTGLAGIKGHFGRVPVWPTPATPTLAHVGPIARSMADAAKLFSVIAGPDGRDPFSVQGPVPDVMGALEAPVTGLRVAYSRTFGYGRPQADVIAATDAAAKALEAQGAIVEDVDPLFDEDPAPLWTAEFYAGVGTRLRPVLEANRSLLDPAAAEILDEALAQEMKAYYDTVFARYALREKMRLFFERYDALVSPVVPVSSVEAGVNLPPGFEHCNLLSWVSYTYPFNLTGNPAGAVRAGTGDDGMPVGLQIVAPPWREDRVAQVAAAVERAMPFGAA